MKENKKDIKNKNNKRRIEEKEILRGNKEYWMNKISYKKKKIIRGYCKDRRRLRKNNNKERKERKNNRQIKKNQK